VSELKKGLPMEVEESPEHTGMKKAFLAKHFSVFLDTEEQLHEEHVPQLQIRPH